MKNILLSALLLVTTGHLKLFAQLTGDTIVCSGFIYTYNVSIPGAVSYTWTTPTGWYDLTGQGTSSINVTCNVTDGDVCVEGFDINANSLGTLCITTVYGGGAGGWDLLPNTIIGCDWPDFTFLPYIQQNGTGGGACPPGCGNGILHPNLVYALYYNAWPSSTFIAIIDGVTPVSSSGLQPGTYYAYFVDITNGTNPPNAIQIIGGCGSATVNNTTSLSFFNVVWPILSASGGSCIGDTVMIYEGTGATLTYWDYPWGCTLISGQFGYPAWVVIDSSYCELAFYGFDVNGCFTNWVWQQTFQPCVPAIAGLTGADTILCPGTCTDFTQQAQFMASVQWFFPGGVPSFSSDFNPQNICYPTPGSYDVTQIAYSPYGNDTLTLTNYITVFPYPPLQSIFQSGDTLFSNPGSASYQWYFDGSLISGATDYFYVAQMSGDYNVVATDVNGCEVEAAISNVVASAQLAIGNSQLAIFPNPVLDKFTIQKLEVTRGTSVEISVYNILGEMVLAVPPLSERTPLEERGKGVRPMFRNFLQASTISKYVPQRRSFVLNL